MSDHYNLLGVAPEAGAEEIRRAFRREAKRCHPDLHAQRPPAEREAMQRRFILLAQAYRVLGDPDRRRAYDRRRASEGFSRATAPAAGATARSQSVRSPGGTTRGESTGSGSTRTSTRKDASGPHASAPRSSSRTASQLDVADLREILQEAEQNLSKFGLDLRQPTGVVLEELMDWARGLYRDLVGAVRGADAGSEATASPHRPGPRRRPSGSGPQGQERAHGTPFGTRRSPRNPEATPTHELAVERELEQLKRGVKTGASRRPPTADDELAELKRKHGRNPATS
jgi:curved DNA-binding protein CbpA